MSTRRRVLTSALAAGATLALGPAISAHAGEAALDWQYFPAGEAGFFRAPVLLSGPTEALLIDGGFTYPDGEALIAAIRTNGKPLSAIYISQSDPDYYFSLKPVLAAFPEARVLAASETLAAIRGNVERKLAVWGPMLGANGPESLADIVFPTAYDEPTLRIDGVAVEIVPAEPGLPNRRYLWVPGLQAVFGGVLIFGGTHVWLADTPGADQRQAWIATLDKLAERAPATVVPGHMVPDAATDATAITATADYLRAFDEELPRAKDAAAMIAAMQARFPDLAGLGMLETSAKVLKGEMDWQ